MVAAHVPVARAARPGALRRDAPAESLRRRRAGTRSAADAAIRAARARRGKDDAGLIAIDGDVAVLELRRVPLIQRSPARSSGRAPSSRLPAGSAGVTLGERDRRGHGGARRDRARAMLAALERQGAAVRAGDLWFSDAVVKELRAKLTLHLARSPSITVIEFKALGALARKQAILLLEHFDQTGLTRRRGEARVLLRGTGSGRRVGDRRT